MESEEYNAQVAVLVQAAATILAGYIAAGSTGDPEAQERNAMYRASRLYGMALDVAAP